MSVNENIYGNKNQWIDSSFNPYIDHKNKTAYFAANQSRLENGVTVGKLSYDKPIDNTLSYCGLGEESALSHIGYIYKDGGSYSLMEWQDSYITNFAFFQQNSTNIDMYVYTRNEMQDNEMQKALFWQPTQSTDNKNKYLQPYTLINPLNQVLLIKVIAFNNNLNDSVDVDLSDYIANYKTSYPYIVCAYILAYFNNQAWTESNPVRTISGSMDTSLNTNLRTFSYGRLDNYICNGKNLDFYSYFLQNCTIFGSSKNFGMGTPTDGLFIVMATENAKEHVKIKSDLLSNMNVYIEYFDGVEDEIKKTVACFGLYFTDKTSVAASGKLTHQDMYIGILDENGVGHGEYLRGADTANAPQNEYQDMSEAGYDYADMDKTKYKDDTLFYDSQLANGFTRFWVLTSAQVSSLLTELYNIMSEVDPDEPIDRYSQTVFLTNNPIDCVVSLKKFPLQNVPSLQGVYFLQLGSKATNIQASPLAKSCGVYYFTFSRGADTSLVPYYNKSFLDYEPYTTAKITIPFCGTVQIPVCYLYDKGGVQVALVIDFISGACTGYVIVGGVTIDSVSGNCAISLPLSGIQSATLDSQIHSVAMAREKQQTTLGTGLIAGAVAIGVGIATGGVATAIGGAAAVIGSFMHAEDTGQQINYELTHMQTPLKQISAASGQIAHTYDMRCKMLITRPQILDNFGSEAQEDYANTIGYACLLSGKVEDFSGFTIGNIDVTGIAATADELQMIRNAFARGVYL